MITHFNMVLVVSKQAKVLGIKFHRRPLSKKIVCLTNEKESGSDMREPVENTIEKDNSLRF